MEAQLLMAGGSILVSGGIAFGIVKATLYNKIDYRHHTEICDKKSNEIYQKIDDNHDLQMKILMEIKQDIGHLKGRIER